MSSPKIILFIYLFDLPLVLENQPSYSTEVRIFVKHINNTATLHLAGEVWFLTKNSSVTVKNKKVEKKNIEREEEGKN